MLSSNREKKRWRDAKASSNPHLSDRTRLQKLSFQNLDGMAEASSAWGLACWQQGCASQLWAWRAPTASARWPYQRGGLRELFLHYWFFDFPSSYSKVPSLRWELSAQHAYMLWKTWTFTSCLGSPIFCLHEPQFSNIFYFLFSTAIPLLFLISFFSMVLKH